MSSHGRCQPRHFEYATLGTAVVVAVATLLAVAVALFGPQWQRRRRRPRLSVDVDGLTEAIILHRDPGTIQLATLRLENARGHDRAEDVEVYLDIGGEFEPNALLPLVEQELLSYGDPRTVPSPPRSQSVAAGFARWLPLLMLGDIRSLAEASRRSLETLPDGCLGAVATARFPQEPAWLIGDQECFITISITGANFDAVFYTGRFLLEATEMDIEGGLTSIDVKWTHALKRTKPDGPPSRLVATP